VIVYTWFVIGFFAAFIAVNSVVLILAAAEVRRYVIRASSAGLLRMLRSPLTPPISVLVPAFNEAAGIVDSVRSLLALDYRQIEVIVISDGSTDDTVGRLTADFDLRQVSRPTPPFLPAGASLVCLAERAAAARHRQGQRGQGRFAQRRD